MATIYERLGGEAAVMAAVPIFYDKVLADERVNRFFEGLDMDAQTKKQIAFMSWAFGGPMEYRGRGLGAAHRKLVQDQGLGVEHFDAIVELLGETLEELGVEEDLRREIAEAVGGLKDDVLGAP
jgi:hemoglobin